MRHAAGVRREIGVRTILNCMGPLLSPVRVKRQLMGCYDSGLVEPLAHVLAALGRDRALVVHGSDGLDDLTTTGPSRAALLDGGRVEAFDVDPEELGIRRARLTDLVGSDPAANAEILRGILDGEVGPRRDVVCLNAGAALWVAESAGSLAEGIEEASASIDSGAARAKLDALVRATREAAG
jgi:anthranilate phosphoribosyltransferase